MGQVTLKQETNRRLLKAIRDYECTIVDVRHEHGCNILYGSGFSHYRILHPDLRGHFKVIDRYDYFENLGNGYGRNDCRFWIYSDYVRVEERSRESIPVHSVCHYLAQEPEECLAKIDIWAEAIKLGEEKWIIGEWYEPVRYINGLSLCDFTLSDKVKIWKPK